MKAIIIAIVESESSTSVFASSHCGHLNQNGKARSII